jgi:hypothetical protein
MTDHPPLRDLVEAMLCTVDDYGPDADTLTIHFEALRAALAARSQPLSAEELAGLCDEDVQTMSPREQRLLATIDYLQAVAGSATPTGDNDD